jgi:hypothetical protein
MVGIRRLWMWVLSLATAGVVTACAVDSTAPVETSQPDALLGLPLNLPLLNGFLQCQAQPYASSTVAIGPTGGVIQVNGHRLTIPAGALDSTVAITMEAPSDTIRSVRFSPEGLVFPAAHRPKLRMDYSQCSLLSLLPKRIVYTDEQFSILEWLLSLDLLSVLKVETHLDHFSRYAIHY